MPLPKYYSDNEQASSYLRLMLGLLGKYKIPPNLVNISLCYESITGNTKLQQKLDDIAKNFTQEKAETLFKDFIWDDEKRTHEKLNRVLTAHFSEALSHMKDISSTTSHSSHLLEEKSLQLECETSEDKLKDIVDVIVKESKNMVNVTQSFEKKLTIQKEELEKLKEELEETKTLAQTDPLTKLKNRRALFTAMEETIASEKELSLMMLDIDFFKKVNDKYGHVIGDKVICFIAQTLTANLKGDDVIARIGGEEFAVLLPSTGIRHAIGLAETIRQSVSKTRLSIPKTQEKLDSVSISIGVALYKKGESCEAFLDRADRALYSAKNTGRNKVVSSA